MDRILIIEDDPAIANSLELGLRVQGFATCRAGNLRQAREALGRERFALILLDVNLPDGNGLDFCLTLQGGGDTAPVILLTANVDEESAVRGLEVGAVDYVRKPFGMKELVARIQRAIGRDVRDKAAVRFHDLILTPQDRRALLEGKAISLTGRQFSILHLLVRRAGDVVTREDILNAWGDEGVLTDRSIDSHVSRLRSKLKARIEIEPVYGEGYRLKWK